MRRKLFTVAAVLSAVLCAVAVAVWIAAQSGQGQRAVRSLQRATPNDLRRTVWGVSWDRSRFLATREETVLHSVNVADVDHQQQRITTDPPSVFSVNAADESEWAVWWMRDFEPLRTRGTVSGQLRLRGVVAPFRHVALATAVLPALFVLSWLCRRHPAGLCPSCGYDLRATPDRCPECGAVPGTKEAA